MSRSSLAAVVLLAAFAALGACGKAATNATNASSPAAAATPAPTAQDDSQTAPARTIADRLLAGGFAPPSGYSRMAPLACSAPANGEAWAIRCRAQFHDSQRRGQPAIVDIQLYDQDAAFDVEDAPMKAHIDSLHGHDTLSTDPGISRTIEKTGQKINLPGACHQAQGPHNSPAYCSVMVTPHVMIIVGVKPAKAASHGMTVSIANGVETNSAAVDMNHAADLLLAITGTVNEARFP